MKRKTDDIFGCFVNQPSECVLASCWPCLLYGEIIHRHNYTSEVKLPLGFWSGCCFYACTICVPCAPGAYLRISRGEHWLTGVLSYTCFPCCALLQDERKL